MTLTKKCTGPCERVLPLDYFNLDKKGKYQRGARCKDCRHLERINARSQTSEYNKKYNAKNKIKIKKLKKEYRAKNKDKISKYQSNYCKNRYQDDVQFKLGTILRRRINKIVTRQQKGGSAVEDLGCSLEELKLYLEKQFYPNKETGENMNWDNYGLFGWHLDHVKPLSSFDLSKRKQFLKACHYTNLQPLWAKENIRKGNKIK